MLQERAYRVSDLIAFFGIAFAWSWAFWLPQVLYSNDLLPYSHFVYLVGFIAPFGPLVSAFSVTYMKEGKNAASRLLRRGFDFRFGKRWLTLVFLFFPLWAGSALLIGALTQGFSVSLQWLSNPLSLVFNFGMGNFVYMFIFVGVAEEFGWRGYALDRIQARLNATASSIVLALIWATWHLPLFFISGSPQRAAGIGPYLAQVVVYSIWFTWVYNNTNRSIFSVIVFHAMMDLTLLTIFPVTSIFSSGSLPVVYMYVSAAVILGAVLAIWGPRRLAREKRRKLPERTVQPEQVAR